MIQIIEQKWHKISNKRCYKNKTVDKIDKNQTRNGNKSERIWHKESNIIRHKESNMIWHKIWTRKVKIFFKILIKMAQKVT